MSDQLVELIDKHRRHGNVLVICECGWRPVYEIDQAEPGLQYAEHLALQIRQHRFGLPVITEAEWSDHDDN